MSRTRPVLKRTIIKNNKSAPCKPHYEPQAPAGVQASPAGAEFKVEKVEEGDGVQPAQGQTVVTHYTGMLENGYVFDTSHYKLPTGSTTPFEFPLGMGRVIKGFDKAFSTLRVGDKAIITIPPELGYGSRDAGKIPPNSTLTFYVELLGVK
jgi:peptidylprolyl isomerase